MGCCRSGKLSVNPLVILYAMFCGAGAFVWLILYFFYIRSDIEEAPRHRPFHVAAFTGYGWNMIFVFVLFYCSNNYTFVQTHDHKRQRVVIAVFGILAAIWMGYLVYVLARFPTAYEFIVEYVLFAMSAFNCLVVCTVAFRHIQKFRKFISEAQSLNPSLSYMDAETLYELILLRKLFSNPIRAKKGRRPDNDNGQLRGFHWDDFYHLHRWAQAFNCGDGAAVLPEMENRLGIYSNVGCPTISGAGMGIQKIEGTGRSRHQIGLKLLALHNSDRQQLFQWVQMLRRIPQIYKLEERTAAVTDITQQMLHRSASYDVSDEVRFRLQNLAKFGIHLNVPMKESVVDPPPPTPGEPREPGAAEEAVDFCIACEYMCLCCLLLLQCLSAFK